MRRFALYCRWLAGACLVAVSLVHAAAADTKLEVSAQDLFGIIAPMEAQDSSTVDLDFPIIKWTKDKVRVSIWRGESTVDPIMDRKVLPLLEDISEATGLGFSGPATLPDADLLIAVSPHLKEVVKDGVEVKTWFELAGGDFQSIVEHLGTEEPTCFYRLAANHGVIERGFIFIPLVASDREHNLCVARGLLHVVGLRGKPVSGDAAQPKIGRALAVLDSVALSILYDPAMKPGRSLLDSWSAAAKSRKAE
jgi:hypothetical protein